MSTWLITGCSSGLGRHLAKEVLSRGHNAVVTARDSSAVTDLVDAHPTAALAISLDVMSSAQVIRGVHEAERRFGAIDVLVNNAGFGYRAAVEEGDEDQVSKLFATNYFGTVAMIKAVLPGMRAQRSGVIVNISSIGTRTCPPGSGYYVAAKAAVEATSASLHKELSPLGIGVMVVQPGAFRTDFNGRSLQMSRTIMSDYAETVGVRRQEAARIHGTQPGNPELAAEAIVAAIESPHRPFMLALGPDAVHSTEAHLVAVRTELEAWRPTSIGTSFPDVGS